MTKPTGRPPGRPRGVKNRRTREVEAAAIVAAEQIGQAVPDAFEGDAHALLMLIYKDPRQPVELRCSATIWMRCGRQSGCESGVAAGS